MNSKVFQHLEKDLFNTGPRSSGFFPTQKSDSSEENDVIVNEFDSVSLKEPVKSSESLSGLDCDTVENMNPNIPVVNDLNANIPTNNTILKKSTSNPDTPTRPKRKRKAETGTQNIKEAFKNAYTTSGDSSSNDVSISSSISPQSSRMNHVLLNETNLSTPKVINFGNVNFENAPNDLAKNKLAEEVKNLKWEVDDLNKNLTETKIVLSSTRECLKNSIIENTKRERNDARKGLRKKKWSDTTALENLKQRRDKLESMQKELATEIANLKKKRGNKDVGTIPEQFHRSDDFIRARKELLKREEAEIIAEKEKLEQETKTHDSEVKRVYFEDSSRFKDFNLLNNQYLPTVLLGKGGFSEVWKAFDLEKCRQTACKIHFVSKDWEITKKANYVKHAEREKDIHKSLDHPNIVKLYDIFKIDNDTFCSVLEYSDGNDLDYYLKKYKTLSEKDTRLVIGQVVDALRYLNELSTPIIHYDLKPANILLQSGIKRFEIKITDFGLSKMFENGGDDMELTSQGAGTMWYLPPETFKRNPRISNKVDVWSVGVICYQCIYGKKPFGDNETQKMILANGTILKATAVDFPQKPTISPLTMDFIRKCLQFEVIDRPDVSEISKHDYVKPFTRK